METEKLGTVEWEIIREERNGRILTRRKEVKEWGVREKWEKRNDK